MSHPIEPLALSRRRALAGALALPALSAGTSRVARLDDEPAERVAAILEAADSFGRGGGYDRSWKSSGCPVAIEVDGATILRGSTTGTYCCGYTFAVAMTALRDAGRLEGRSVADLRAFQKRWYGATSIEDERERQCAVAVAELGVGREVPHDEALPGDFVQLWRKRKKPSGHSVLFLSWITVGDERIGLCYLSSQGSTDGIGHAVEYFVGASAGRGTVDPKRTYVARLDLEA